MCVKVLSKPQNKRSFLAQILRDYIRGKYSIELRRIQTIGYEIGSNLHVLNLALILVKSCYAPIV